MLRLFIATFLYGVAVRTTSVASFSGWCQSPTRASTQLSARKTMVKEQVPSDGFDPLCLSERDPLLDFPSRNNNARSVSTSCRSREFRSRASATAAAAATSAVALATTADSAYALDKINLDSFKAGLTVENFQPVCGTSDGLYRVLQQTIAATVGPESYKEYGPLIAGGLLRVRLELCVVESFFNEAVGPFIRDNGLSWILPLHETVETFIAGGIFAIATTFILIGSTKLVTVIVTYTDFLIGLPARLFGGFAFDRAQGKPVTLDVGFGPFKARLIGPPKESEPIDQMQLKDLSIVSVLVLIISGAVNYFGQALRLLREFLEAVDAFVGRYLAVWASAYLIIKFVHFKIFPDFP